MPFHDFFNPSVRNIFSLFHYALCSMPSAFLFCYDMAILTRPPCERRMVIGLEELRILRGMRVMTMPAIHDSRFDTDMSFAKARPVIIVTFSA
jgi:hypothetical protein